tara:strand:+ start:630 stop:1427 length:798 start_codon:yes stop_codon:yes gene_type:complete
MKNLDDKNIATWEEKTLYRVESLEKSFGEILDNIIDSQEAMVVNNLNSSTTLALLGLGEDADFSSVAPLSDLAVSTNPLLNEMSKAYVKGVEDTIEEGVGTKVDQEIADAALSENLSVVNNFNSTTQEEVIAALQTAASFTGDEANGDTDVAYKAYIAAILIKMIFNKLRNKRKNLIVETGVLGAYNMGIFDAGVGMFRRDPTLKKQWVSRKDGKVRIQHRDLNGEEVPVNSAFYVNGAPIRFPKDPLASPNLTINCRCVLKFVR